MRRQIVLCALLSALIPLRRAAIAEETRGTQLDIDELRTQLADAMKRLDEATRQLNELDRHVKATEEARSLRDPFDQRLNASSAKLGELREIDQLRDELRAVRVRLASVEMQRSAVAWDHGLVLRAGDARLTFNTLVQARLTGESLFSAAQPGLRFPGVDSFDLHHAELAVAGDAGRWARAVLMIDLGNGYTPGAPFAIHGSLLRDAYVDIKPLKWITLRVGQFVVPFGRQRTLDDRVLAAPDRNLATLAFTLDRDLGGMIELRPWEDFILVQFAITDGINAGESGARNDNLDFRYVGHIALSPLGAVAPVEGDPSGNGGPRFTLGGAVLYDLTPTNDPVNQDRNGDGRVDNVEILSANAELAVSFWRLSAQAEYFWRRENYGVLAPVVERSYQGFYAQLQGVLWPSYAMVEAHLAYAEPHVLGTATAIGATPATPFPPPPGQNSSPLDTLQPSTAWQAGGSLIGLFRTHDMKLQLNYDWHQHVVEFTQGCVAMVPCEVNAHVLQIQITAGF